MVVVSYLQFWYYSITGKSIIRNHHQYYLHLFIIADNFGCGKFLYRVGVGWLNYFYIMI
jgi:hypothetical protein